MSHQTFTPNNQTRNKATTSSPVGSPLGLDSTLNRSSRTITAVLRGNYHNVGSDQVESLSGSVDKTTQRAAWTIGDDKAPVYEAGIANLTKDATPMLVHLGTDRRVRFRWFGLSAAVEMNQRYRVHATR